MKHKMIMRLKIIGNLSSMKEELTYLFKYTLQSIISQTNQDYWCIVEYQKEAEELLSEEKQKYPHIAEKILFTTSMRDLIKSLLIDESLSGYEDIWFIKINTRQVYPLDMIEQFNNYMRSSRIRVLILQQGYIYNSSNKQLYKYIGSDIAAYIYVCGIEEYKKHFCVYDYYHPHILEKKYPIFKNALLEQKVLSIKAQILNEQAEKLILLTSDEKNKCLASFKLEEV